MTLPEAIVYLLASSNHGMKTDQIARLVNEKGLYQRWDKQRVIDIINKSDDSWQAKDHKKPPSPDYPIKIYIERDALSKYRDKWEMLLANA